MTRRLIEQRKLSEQELKVIVLKMRFGGAEPDLSAPVFMSLKLLSRATRKPLSWIRKFINESLPADQRHENQVKDWGTLDKTFLEK